MADPWPDAPEGPTWPHHVGVKLRQLRNALAARPAQPVDHVNGPCALLAAAAHLRYGDRSLPDPPDRDLETRWLFADWLEECAAWRAGGDR